MNGRSLVWSEIEGVLGGHPEGMLECKCVCRKVAGRCRRRLDRCKSVTIMYKVVALYYAPRTSIRDESDK
jgi:hypothetical protein